jgi:hypothetical protein
MTTALPYTWDGEALRPMRPKLCDKELVIGALYFMEAKEVRSEAAHRSYFASIRDAWLNLPEDETDRFPTPESLRKYALIKTGYCKKRDIVCANNAQAIALVAVISDLDAYSLVTVSERVVSVWTAESQSYKAMGKKRFNESQNAVRDYCASLIGVAPEELERESA